MVRAQGTAATTRTRVVGVPHHAQDMVRLPCMHCFMEWGPYYKADPIYRPVGAALRRPQFMPDGDDAYRGGGNSGRGQVDGENFAIKKSGEVSPPANVSRRVTNNFTANSDAGEY